MNKKILLSIIILIGALFLLPGKIHAAGDGALRLYPFEGDLALNQEQELQIRLFTDATDVDSADVIITHSGVNIEVVDALESRTGVNMAQGQAFGYYINNSYDSLNNKFSLTGYSLTPLNTQGGYTLLASIHFIPLQEGQLQFDIQYVNSSTTDSNIIEHGSSSDILTFIRNAQFDITESSGSSSQSTTSTSSSDSQSTDSSSSSTQSGTTSENSTSSFTTSSSNSSSISSLPNTGDRDEDKPSDDDSGNGIQIFFDDPSITDPSFIKFIKENKYILVIISVLPLIFFGFIFFNPDRKKKNNNKLLNEWERMIASYKEMPGYVGQYSLLIGLTLTLILFFSGLYLVTFPLIIIYFMLYIITRKR